jgi:hypothetical protein
LYQAQADCSQLLLPLASQPAPVKSATLIFLMGNLHLVGNGPAGKPTVWDQLRSNQPRFIRGERAAVALTWTDVAPRIAVAHAKPQIKKEDE